MTQAVPMRPGWRLLRKLGRGGFGEAGLGEHSDSSELRALKFCYRQSRLNTPKREIALLRLLHKGMSGEGIAPMLGWHLDSPPYFVEKHSETGVTWSDLDRIATARAGRR